MGRKKKAARHGEPEADEGSLDSSGASASELSAEAVGTSDSAPDVEPIEDLLDKICEKRSSTRIEGIHSLVRLLQRTVLKDETWERNRASLLDSLVRCVRRGTSEEACLALRALGILSITFGEQAESIFNTVHGDLPVPPTSAGSADLCAAVCCFC